MSDHSATNKRIAKNTLMMYLRMFVTMGISLFTSRVILNALGVEDFGIFNVVGGMVTMFTFVNAAMMAATQRFINFELGKNNQAGLKEVFHTAYLIHIIICILLVIVGISLGKYIVDHQLKIPPSSLRASNIVLYCSVINCALQILTLPYSSDVLAHERINVYATISIVESVLKLIVAFLIKVSASGRLSLYAGLLLLVQFCIYLIYLFYCHKNFNEVRGRLRIYKDKLIEMGKFAIWALIGCTAGAFSTQGVNVLLGMFFSPIVNAARGIAAQVQNAITTFGSNLNTAMTPQITQSYASKDYDLFFMLIYKGSNYIFYLMSLVAIPILIKTQYILFLWLGEIPQYTIIFLRLLVCSTIIETISYPLMRASDATGTIRLYHSVVGGILLTILPLSYIAIKITNNPTSAFYVYFIVNIVAWFARLVILRTTANLSIKEYINKVMSRIVFVFIISISINYYLASYFSDNILTLFAFILICLFITSFLFWIIVMEKSEKKYVIIKLNNILKRNDKSTL